MCVISISPRGVKPFTEAEVKDFWDRNPDGAGVGIDLGNGVVLYEKGFMNLPSLLQWLKKAEKVHDLTKSLYVIHCRIGTSGGKRQETTHPFLLSTSYEDLCRTSYMGNRNIAFHNGVITGFSGIINPNSSDTMDFVAGMTPLLYHKQNKIRKFIVEKLITTDKLCILNGSGEPVLYGTFIKKEDGRIYSNVLWETQSYYGTQRALPVKTYAEKKKEEEKANASVKDTALVKELIRRAEAGGFAEIFNNESLAAIAATADYPEEGGILLCNKRFYVDWTDQILYKPGFIYNELCHKNKFAYKETIKCLTKHGTISTSVAATEEEELENEVIQAIVDGEMEYDKCFDSKGKLTQFVKDLWEENTSWMNKTGQAA
jgi:hypothetical protein